MSYTDGDDGSDGGDDSVDSVTFSTVAQIAYEQSVTTILQTLNGGFIDKFIAAVPFTDQNTLVNSRQALNNKMNNDGLMGTQRILATALWAEQNRAGNCEEFSCVALKYLYYNTSYISAGIWHDGIGGSDFGNHQITILNGPFAGDNSDAFQATDPNSWSGSNIWVIDGWNKYVFAFDTATFGQYYGAQTWKIHYSQTGVGSS